IDLPGTLRTKLADPVAAYFAGDPTPTVGELVDALKKLLPGFSSSTNEKDGKKELRFDLNLDETISTSIPIDLGSEASRLGLALDASAAVDLQAALHAGGLGGKFTFGIDLTPGLDPSQAFFLLPGDTLEASSTVNASALNF